MSPFFTALKHQKTFDFGGWYTRQIYIFASDKLTLETPEKYRFFSLWKKYIKNIAYKPLMSGVH